MDWLDSCRDFCDNISFTSFNRLFLAPHLYKFQIYTQFIAKELITWEAYKKTNKVEEPKKEEKEDEEEIPDIWPEEMDEDDEERRRRRILEEKPNEEKSELKLEIPKDEELFKVTQWSKYKQPDVFSAASGALVQIDSFKRIYSPFGINPY